MVASIKKSSPNYARLFGEKNIGAVRAEPCQEAFTYIKFIFTSPHYSEAQQLQILGILPELREIFVREEARQELANKPKELDTIDPPLRRLGQLVQMLRDTEIAPLSFDGLTPKASKAPGVWTELQTAIASSRYPAVNKQAKSITDLVRFPPGQKLCEPARILMRLAGPTV